MSLLLLLLISIFILGFVLSFFFSGFETGGYSLSAIRFELRQAENYKGAKILARHLSDMPGLIATTLVGTNLGNYLLTAAVVGMLQPMDAQTVEILSTLLLTPFIFVFVEVLPKELFRRHADEIMYRAAKIFRFGSQLFYPATYFLGFVPVLLRKLGLTAERSQSFGASKLDRFSIELTRGTEEGVLSPNQVTMARRIMSLGTRTVQNAMVPLWRVVKWEQGMDLEQAKSRMAQIPYSRVPIYEGNSANLIGTVWIYDVCFGAEQGLKDYVRPVRAMKAEMPIDAALLTLRNNHEPMAFVEDRRGRILGIVTLKDLVTEIVTDLHDL